MMDPPADRRNETHPPTRGDDPATRLATHDAGALAALHDRHAGAMYSLAMRIAGEPADAEAVVRDVFAALRPEAERRPGERAPDAQRLLSATRVRAIEHVRARGAADAQADDDDPPVAAQAPHRASAGEQKADVRKQDGDGVREHPNRASAGEQTADVATLRLPDPVEGRITGEDGPVDAPRLRAAFRALPPLERLAIELAYFEGLTISQIAARLEQAPGAANARIRTGLQRLAGGAGARRAHESRRDASPTHELAGLYALGALNAGERAAFDAHLEAHRESVDEVLSLLPVTRRLAWAAPPHEPPPGLRERVVRTVTGAPPPERTPPGRIQRPAAARRAVTGVPPPESPPPGRIQRPAAARRAVTGAPPPKSTPPLQQAAPTVPKTASTAPKTASTVPKTASTVPKTTPAMPKPTPTAQKKGRRRVLLALVAGSLAAAAGLGLWGSRQANLATALQENLDAANTQARIAELETAAALRIADALRDGARVLTATDVRTLDLTGQPAAPDARGRLFWSAGEGGLLTATGLPPAPPGLVYQLWLIPDTTPVRAALLQVDAEGRAMAAATPPDGVTEPVPAAVTLEPAGGAATPGGDVYLLGRP